jgi:ribosome assembly protein RRB1
MPQSPGVLLTMADNGYANIFDATAAMQALMSKGPRATAPSKPSFIFKGHTQEGFAVDWSPVRAGRAATGDCAGCIHIWSQGGSASTWSVDSAAYRGHTSSVEDLQWSPTEETVFASCSADKTVRIWDTRGRSGAQISLAAHTQDVNVISWNKGVGYLLASGADDGSFKVWDLRAMREASPVAHFTHHKGAVTSIEWAPNDDSSLAVSSADDQVTVWDLSVEADDGPGSTVADYPPQLLFIHQGQRNVKELHYHPQCPGAILTTAEDGLNVFKPAIHVST